MFGLGFFRSGKESAMWLLAGLGNPGEKYSRQRHNIGFMVIDTIASDLGLQSLKSKFSGVYALGNIGGEKVALLKPLTMMNNSGQSVSAAARFFRIPPERVIVFHDDIDLAAGKVRVKKGGGAAGHNGIRSCDAHLGTQEYWRVRVGVGHPGDKEKVHGHVLGDFSKSDQEWLEPLLERISDNADLLIEGRMNDFASKATSYKK
jgi:PTH1 family peptidyl-tRNA hydrolase